jgi:hypothetical protein
MFSSQLYKNEVIFNDETPAESLDVPVGMGRGLDLGLRGPGEFEYGEFANPFPKELLIPRSEWQARIQEMEEQKSRISDLIRLKKFPCKNQKSTNFCWIFAPTHCVEINRLQQNQRTVSLSPASAGGPIKGYRNSGGWGLEGLQYIAKFGLVPSAKWPDTAIDKRYATPENKELALDYRVDEWMECRPRNVDEMISMLLRRYPGAGGYNWWSHEVTNCDPVWLDGDVAVRIRNSWENWGDFGFGILQGSKMLADDLVFCLNARPT